jgi:small subunit ribosomal protein S13
MIRIAGVNVNDKKQSRFALTSIKGIGQSNVLEILGAVGIEPVSPLGDLEEKQLVALRNHIEENYLTEADLGRQQRANIKRLIDINSYRGSRHKSRLPVRGQTTRTNSRTVRGNVRQTGSSGRAKSASKT